MAKVWFVKEGPEPTRRGPWRELPLSECQTKLGLTQADFLCDLSTAPRFGDLTARLAAFREPKYVIVELDDDEAQKHSWKAGFYRLNLSPEDAEHRYSV